MAAFNLTLSGPSTFILNGIPGLEDAHLWISIPFSALYILSLLCNSIVIFVVTEEQTLHKPMYLLLCMLAITGIGLSSFIVLNTLCLFLFHLKKITVEGCMSQIVLLNAIDAMHSAVLVTMAFDRYIAICDPLRYTIILTNPRMAKLGLVGLIRAFLFAFLPLFFLQMLPFCARHVIPHIYCKFTTLVQMSCTETAVSWLFSFVAPLVTIMSDLSLITFSYVLIIRTVLRTYSKKAYQRAVNNCTTQVFVILTFYPPFLVSILTKTFGKGIPDYIHTLLASLYVLVPLILNPIIYSIKTKELSHQLGKCICRM